MPELIVRIVGDASSLQKSYRQAEQSTSKFSREMERTGRGVAVASIGFRGLGRSVAFASGSFLAGAGLGAAIKSSIGLASDLNEQISKTNVVFGASAKQVEDWSKTSATSMGLARNEALGLASSFGALFAPLGLVGKQAAKQSEDLTQLGADLASFYNTNVADALDAIKSGLVGESRPLRAYGVLLSETRVQQEALTETGKANARQLTDHDKVLARIALIYKDSKQAQGDFARTSDGLANQTRILTAQFKNLATSIADAFIPGLINMTKALNNSIDKLKEAGGWLDRLHLGFLKFGQTDTNFKLTSLSQMVQLLKLGGPYAEAINKALTDPKVLEHMKGLDILAQNLEQSLGAAADQVAAFAGFKIPIALQNIAADRLAGIPPKAAVEGAATDRAVRLNKYFDARIGRMMGRVGDVAALRDQIARYRIIAGLIQQRINATKDITRRLNLEDQLADVNQTIRNIRDRIAQNRRQAYWAKKLRDQQIEQMRTDRQQGYLQFAIERADATKNMKDDIKTRLKYIDWLKEQIRLHGRSLELLRELWQTRQQIRDLNKKNADVDPLAGLMQVSSKRTAQILAAGTGLGLTGIRRLEANIAGAELQPLHVHVHIDGQQVAAVVAKQQARTGRRTAKQTSGFRG